MSRFTIGIVALCVMSFGCQGSEGETLPSDEMHAGEAATQAAFLAGEAAQVSFLSSPSGGIRDATLSPVIVAVLDENGGPASESVLVQISLHSGAGNLSGTLSQPSASGVAIFWDLSIDEAGEDYTLEASALGLPSVQSFPFDIAPCAGSLVDCSGECVDLSGDDLHCGACGVACGSEQACVAGSCECFDSSMVACDDVCTDVQEDPSNCGECGNACDSEMGFCYQGACECFVPGQKSCDGLCIDVQDDDLNCGGCGMTCGDDQSCTAGACSCHDSTKTNCDGTCTDTDTDAANCGGCGLACESGEVCDAGVCTSPCDAGELDCNGVCVNPSDDPLHCGGCNIACNTNDLCAGGACMPDPEWANWPIPREQPLNTDYDYTTNPAVVVDRVTKLMWERTPSPSLYDWNGARARCANLSLGGYDDWRLPTRIELLSIVHSGRQNPSINPTAFLSTAYDTYYWSGTTYAGDPTQAWLVSFQWGNADPDDKSLATDRVRCVRYGPGYPTAASLPTSRYTATLDTVLDQVTGLRWERNAPFFSSDVDYGHLTNCYNKVYGVTRGQLPRKKELESLVDVRKVNPAFGSLFSGPTSHWYWTYTNHVTSSNIVWSVSSGSGRTKSSVWNDAGVSRCVWR